MPAVQARALGSSAGSERKACARGSTARENCGGLGRRGYDEHGFAFMVGRTAHQAAAEQDRCSLWQQNDVSTDWLLQRGSALRVKECDMQTPDASDLTVRFLGGPPSEEVVRFAQRCASRTALASPMTLVLQWNADKSAAREVRLECEGEVLLSEADPDLFLAVRNAFARATTAARPAQKQS